MNALVRRRLEMAARARDFLRAHQVGTDGNAEVPALVRLEELVQRGQVLVTQQRSGLAAVRAAAKQRFELRQMVRTKLLPYLVAVGAMATRENLALAAQFRMPSKDKASHLSFLGAVRNILEKATAQKDVLLKEGMPVTLLDDLTAAVNEFEQTLEASRAGRRDHVGPSADLSAIAAEIVENVRVLDGLVRYRFGDDSELMGAWRSARNVLGPFRSRSVPEQQQGPGGSQPKAA